MRISESNAVRYLARAIPYSRFRRRKGVSHTLRTLSEVTSIYADFIPHADKIKVEPLDEFYTYETAISLIDVEFLKYLMLEAPGNRISWQTICAWLVLLSGRVELCRVFEQGLSKSGVSEINKEVIELVLDDRRGRKIDENRDIYEYLEVVREAIAKSAPITPKRKVVRATSREGKRIIKAFKNDYSAVKSLYKEKGAAAAANWARTRSWYWYYTDLDDLMSRMNADGRWSNDGDQEWHWGYWL